MMEGGLVLWAVLVIFRIWWSLAPQSGYIHPDEFFQTVEVVAGNVFDTKVTRSWEFNSTFPLRSVVIPKLLFQPVFKLLKFLNDSNLMSVSGWMVVSSSRLLMAVLSLWIDFCVYKICRYIGKDHSVGLLMIASSYVTVTYQCHTFTNSFESLLFSSLIYIIFYSVNDLNRNQRKHMKKSKLVRTQNMEHDTAAPSEGLRTMSYFACVSFATVSVAGVFNRPTFVLFSFLPSVWWFYIMIRHWKSIMNCIGHTFVITLSAAITAAIFCSVDSLYFNNLSVTDLVSDVNSCLPITSETLECLSSATVRNFVFTPLNFIQYNSRGDNLAEHGLHPFYLHFCINMPLLFGPLMMYFLKSLPQCFKDIYKGMCSVLKTDHLLDNQNNDANFTRKSPDFGSSLIVIFILVPVTVFSIFPHQEPRFLIPLLPLVVILSVLAGKSFSKYFIASVLIFNVLLTIIYGVLHQGGVIPCILYIQKDHNTDQITGETFVSHSYIFSHTYMPPQFPLLIQSSNIKVLDLQGGNALVVASSVQNIKSVSERQSGVKSRIFLILPATVYKDVIESAKLNVTLVEKFYPHLSFEDLPTLSSKHTDSFVTSIKVLFDQLFLFLLEIH